MIQFKRTDHINICVPQDRLEEAYAFYTDVMGLEPIERPDETFDSPGYWFKIADIELHINAEPAFPKTGRHTAFEVTDLAAARQHLEAKGIKLTTNELIPGRDRFSFFDPFGNRMELLAYI